MECKMIIAVVFKCIRKMNITKKINDIGITVNNCI